MASVYLLTVKKKVWEHFEGHVDGEDGISGSIFEGIEFRNETEETLIATAYDLLFCMRIRSKRDYHAFVSAII